MDTSTGVGLGFTILGFAVPWLVDRVPKEVGASGVAVGLALIGLPLVPDAMRPNDLQLAMYCAAIALAVGAGAWQFGGHRKAIAADKPATVATAEVAPQTAEPASVSEPNGSASERETTQSPSDRAEQPMSDDGPSGDTFDSGGGPQYVNKGVMKDQAHMGPKIYVNAPVALSEEMKSELRKLDKSRTVNVTAFAHTGSKSADVVALVSDFLRSEKYDVFNSMTFPAPEEPAPIGWEISAEHNVVVVGRVQ